MFSIDFNPVVLNVGKAEGLSDWNYKNVSSPFARVYLVTEGTASIRINGKTTGLRPGHLYLIPPYVAHDDICSGPFTHYYLHFYERGSSAFKYWDLPVEVKADEFDRFMFTRLVESNPQLRLREYDPEVYENAIDSTRNTCGFSAHDLSSEFGMRACVLSLMSRFLKFAKLKGVKRDDRIQEIIQYMDENIGDPNMNVVALSDRACLSVNQFIRRFSAETSMTPSRYLARKRIELAQILLIEKGLDNKTVATLVGIEDPAYFCRLFKQLVGISPRAYRDSEMKNLYQKI